MPANTLTYSEFIEANDTIIKETLQDMSTRGFFYRSSRAILTLFQYLPPINFMSSQYDVIFSDVLNQKFYGTSVMVNTIKSQHWNNIWAVPIGAPNASRPLLQSIPFYNILRWYKIYEEQNLNYKLIQRGINIKDGLIEIKGMPNVTMYRTERQAEILNLDEQIAVSLFEVSKNALLFDYLVNKRVSKITGFLSAVLAGGGTFAAFSDMERFAIIAILIASLIAIIPIYNNRKYVWDSDDLVKRMGYGKHMATALTKMDAYHSGYAFKFSGLNAPEQLINTIDTLYYQIMKLLSFVKLNFTPYVKDRINILQKDNNLNDIKADNIIINNQVDYFMSYLDKLDVTIESIIKTYVEPEL